MSDARLIDANALINVLHAKLCSIDNGRTMRQAAIPVADGMRIMELEYCIGLIQCADIIDAVPVVHGRWVKSNKHIWRKRADGEIDHFAVDFEYHNGPECEICGLSFCEHCHPEKFDEESCKDQYFCSVCGRMEMKEEPYCHCGAKMDAKEE